jgi:thiamine-phosphate pyrophosphorylase
VNDRRQRLGSAHLYLVCDERSDDFLHAALRGGVDVVQLRVKAPVSDSALVSAGRRYAAACERFGALLILNDRPDLVVATGADGVHVGQDDAPVAVARELAGADRLVGLSTHSPAQIDAAAVADVDYIGVGPVHVTPTKPGRPAVGVELVEYAASRTALPWFAIGGIDESNVAAVRAAGAQRIAVVRAIADADDPEAAARGLRAAVGVGAGAGLGAT